jgi:hypothetical protein
MSRQGKVTRRRQKLRKKRRERRRGGRRGRVLPFPSRYFRS